jgi:short-subunit dehydrogenase
MTVVITGASRGIGKALAQKFASQKFDLALCARTEKDLLILKEQIASGFPGIEIFIKKCDVSKKREVLSFAEDVKQHFKAVDVLINNAGVFIPGSVHNEDDGALEKVMETNLYSAYHLTRALIQPMMDRKSGDIFNICSVASISAYENGGSYSISKFAMLGFSKNLREEMKPHNVRVTPIILGATYTDSWESAGIPPERFIKPEDVAKAVWDVHCLSKQSVVEEIVIRPQLGDI